MPSDQGELLPREAVPQPPAGPLEEAARRSVAAADLEARDEAGAALVIYLAWQLDRAGRATKQYVIAGLAQQYRETLIEYGLAPTKREGGERDPLTELLEQFATPTVGDAAHP